AGDYTVTVSGKKYPAPPKSLRIFFDLDPSGDNYYIADFGYDEQHVYLPASIHGMIGELEKGLGSTKSKAESGDKYQADLRVTENSVELRYQRKSLLKIKRKDATLGHVAIFVDDWDDLTLEGKVEPSWYRSLVDSTLAKQREEFENTFDVKKQLPPWLFAHPKSKRTPASSDSWLPGNGIGEAMIAVINLWQQGKTQDAITALAKLTDQDAESVVHLF